MKVEVVAIGTELLLGQIVDTNSSWIGEQLALAGLDSHYQTKVGDNPARIREVLIQALERSDAVICCGGLGPTQDDLTRDVIAEVMGVELVRDDTIVARITEMFRSRGRDMPANNLRQAEVPVGARTIPQQPGTAPGLICPVRGPWGEKVIYAVPGVPYEMQAMMTGTIVSDLVERSGERAVIRSRVLRTWGSSESALAEMLAERIIELDEAGNPTIAFLASGVEGLKVRVTAKSPTEAEAVAVLDAEEGGLRRLLGPLVFGLDDQNMESVVIEALRQRGLTLGLAETITGGYVSARLTAAPGADEVYRGAVVAHDPELERSVLGLESAPSSGSPESDSPESGSPASESPESEDTAPEAATLALARRARLVLGADVGLAVTGAVGPGDAARGESRPVGTVCLAIAGIGAADGGDGIVTTVRLPGDRERIRQFASISLLDLLRRTLAADQPSDPT